jgi:hypothetical protein
MALTLRPTGLGKSVAFAHLADYSVYDDGREIGRIYEVHAPSRPEVAWTWSIIVMGEARGHVTTDGNAPHVRRGETPVRRVLGAVQGLAGAVIAPAPRRLDSALAAPIFHSMRLYLVAYQTPKAEFVGAAIVRAFDEFRARQHAEEAGIHQPGALSQVSQIDEAPPDLIGRRLSPRDVARLVKAGPKKPPAPSV